MPCCAIPRAAVDQRGVELDPDSTALLSLILNDHHSLLLSLAALDVKLARDPDTSALKVDVGHIPGAKATTTAEGETIN